MQTVYLTAADVARTRFTAASLPLLESSLALAAFQADRYGRLPDAVPGQPQLPLRAAARPLLDLVRGQIGPKFLDPLTSDLDEGLELLQATPRAVIKSELQRVLSGRATSLPTWVRNLADGDREEREIVETAVRACHKLFVGPLRAQHDRAFERDIAARMRTLRDGGIAGVLANLHPQLRFHDGVLEMPHPRNQALYLHGEGLELTPTVSWTGPPMLTSAWNQPDRWLLIYPITQVIGIVPETDAVAPLIGPSRTAILRQLRKPATTGELAARLRLSAASISQHTTVLRNAGLIDSRRTGRTVHHVLTALGEALLSGTLPPHTGIDHAQRS